MLRSSVLAYFNLTPVLGSTSWCRVTPHPFSMESDLPWVMLESDLAVWIMRCVTMTCWWGIRKPYIQERFRYFMFWFIDLFIVFYLFINGYDITFMQSQVTTLFGFKNFTIKICKLKMYYHQLFAAYSSYVVLTFRTK